MSILYVGIDLAKNVFAVHGVSAAGVAELCQPTDLGVGKPVWAAVPPVVLKDRYCPTAPNFSRLSAGTSE